MTRVLPLPAPARISTGPSVVSTASRCCGLSWSRKDNAGVAPELVFRFYRVLRRPGAGAGQELFRGSCGLALPAGANLAKELPGVNTQVVPIVPFEPDGVFADS